jgi:hypothetical protein
MNRSYRSMFIDQAVFCSIPSYLLAFGRNPTGFVAPKTYLDMNDIAGRCHIGGGPTPAPACRTAGMDVIAITHHANSVTCMMGWDGVRWTTVAAGGRRTCSHATSPTSS